MVEEKADQNADLKAKYKELSGKDPDGRWNTGRLTVEISKLEKANA